MSHEHDSLSWVLTYDGKKQYCCSKCGAYVNGMNVLRGGETMIEILGLKMYHCQACDCFHEILSCPIPLPEVEVLS